MATLPAKKSRSDPLDGSDPVLSVLLQIRDSIGKLDNRISTLEKKTKKNIPSSPSASCAPLTALQTDNLNIQVYYIVYRDTLCKVFRDRRAELLISPLFRILHLTMANHSSVNITNNSQQKQLCISHDLNKNLTGQF